LEIPDEEIEDYFRGQPTRSEHWQELIDLYGFRFYTLGRGAGVESLVLDAGPALGISGSAGGE
jgi:hypothetical protein